MHKMAGTSAMYRYQQRNGGAKPDWDAPGFTSAMRQSNEVICARKGPVASKYSPVLDRESASCY